MQFLRCACRSTTFCDHLLASTLPEDDATVQSQITARLALYYLSMSSVLAFISVREVNNLLAKALYASRGSKGQSDSNRAPCKVVSVPKADLSPAAGKYCVRIWCMSLYRF